MKKSLSQITINVFLIVLGSIVCAWAINSILVPHEFLNGGLVGVGLIIHYLVPSLGLGLLIGVLNIPLFLVGWFHISRRFIYYTGFGILVFSVAVEVLKSAPMLPVENDILAAILAGILYGLGSGTILRSAGSVGGFDIISAYFYKKYDLRMGMTAFIINSFVLLLGAVLFNLEMALYTLIFVFTTGKLTDAVITGFNRRKAVMVISDKSDEIADALMNQLHRGVTFLDGMGAFTRKEKKVVFSVVAMTELARMKDKVFTIDPNAFVVINDTLDVLGVGLPQRKVY